LEGAEHLAPVDRRTLPRLDPVEFRCGCSRERVHRALLALGRTELEDLLATEGQAEATGEFGTTRYVIPAAELRTLIGSVSPG
jgi:molecular chaperone Hsp33